MKKESFLSSLIGFFGNGQSAEKKEEKPKEPRPNTWGVTGRLAQMQTRTLMQLKGFERK